MASEIIFFIFYSSYLIDKSACQVGVVVNATVTEEGPPAAHLLGVVEVEVDDDALFFVSRSLIEEFALGPATKEVPQNWIPFV